MAEHSIADALYADAQERLRRQINANAEPYGWAIIPVGAGYAPRWVGPDSFRNDQYPVLYDSIWDLAKFADHGVEAAAVEWLRRNCLATYRRMRAGVPDTVPLTSL